MEPTTVLQLTLDQFLIYVVGALLALLQFFLGFFVKTLFDRITKLENQDGKLATAINELTVSLPTHYVLKNDFTKMGDDIFNALRRIEDKLDTKVDK